MFAALNVGVRMRGGKGELQTRGQAKHRGSTLALDGLSVILDPRQIHGPHIP